jgi:hypothetical protein
MTSTRRGLLPAIQPGFKQIRQAEERERRWRRKLPPWGGRNPATGLWEFRDRSGGGDKLGFWEHDPEGWGIVGQPVMGAEWTKTKFARTPRQSSGLSTFEHLTALAIGTGQLRSEWPDDEPALSEPPPPSSERRRPNPATRTSGLDRESWEQRQPPDPRRSQ